MTIESAEHTEGNNVVTRLVLVLHAQENFEQQEEQMSLHCIDCPIDQIYEEYYRHSRIYLDPRQDGVL